MSESIAIAGFSERESNLGVRLRCLGSEVASLPQIDVRKGMPPVKLSQDEFEKRYLSRSPTDFHCRPRRCVSSGDHSRHFRANVMQRSLSFDVTRFIDEQGWRGEPGKLGSGSISAIGPAACRAFSGEMNRVKIVRSAFQAVRVRIVGSTRSIHGVSQSPPLEKMF